MKTELKKSINLNGNVVEISVNLWRTILGREYYTLTKSAAAACRKAGLSIVADCGNPYHGGLRTFNAKPREGMAITFSGNGTPAEMVGTGYRKWTSRFSSGYTRTYFEPSTLSIQA